MAGYEWNGCAFSKIRLTPKEIGIKIKVHVNQQGEREGQVATEIIRVF